MPVHKHFLFNGIKKDSYGNTVHTANIYLMFGVKYNVFPSLAVSALLLSHTMLKKDTCYCKKLDWSMQITKLKETFSNYFKITPIVSRLILIT